MKHILWSFGCFFALFTFLAIVTKCHKEAIHDQIEGKWESMFPAHPHWYYNFTKTATEDGELCQKLSQWGHDSEDCFYRWFCYGTPDTLVISGDGKARTWVLNFDGTTVVKVTDITEGNDLFPTFYLHRSPQ